MSLRLVHNAGAPAGPAPDPAAAEPDGGGFAILSRRVLPGSRTFVDHILIGPPGVFAVARKRLSGTIRIVRGRLTVNGVARDAIADHVCRFSEALHRIVVQEFGDIGIPITPIVCVEGVEPPKNATVGGVPLLSKRGLGRMLRKAPGALSRRDIDTLTGLFGSRLQGA